MRFSVGILDTLFGKKVAVKVPDGNGNLISRSVTKKWLDRMDDSGHAGGVEQRVIKVHMLDAVEGYHVFYWVIGVDIEEVNVNRFRDKDTDDLYALHYFEDESKIELIDKSRWELANKKFQTLHDN